MLQEAGWTVFPATPATRGWAEKAREVGLQITRDPAKRQQNLRHGDTWFVGVDALPNDEQGSLDGVPFKGPWADLVDTTLPLHRAQLSVIYPGYPRRDAGQSVANHRYRVKRRAAHVDGLLPIGNPPRRHAHEYHAYILGIHLNACQGAPTVVWPGSHKIIGRALRAAIGDRNPAEVDITDAYHSARREVFDTCDRIDMFGEPGEAFLLHRFTLHGTNVWHDGWGQQDRDQGRMTAFFRPECRTPSDWLGQP